jgi:hypothetical protein
MRRLLVGSRNPARAPRIAQDRVVRQNLCGLGLDCWVGVCSCRGAPASGGKAGSSTGRRYGESAPRFLCRTGRTGDAPDRECAACKKLPFESQLRRQEDARRRFRALHALNFSESRRPPVSTDVATRRRRRSCRGCLNLEDFDHIRPESTCTPPIRLEAALHRESFVR